MSDIISYIYSVALEEWKLATSGALGMFIVGVHLFYLYASIMLPRQHLTQIKKYRTGTGGLGDTCLKSQWMGVRMRTAPLLYSITIGSWLLFISVLLDLIGRIASIIEGNKAQKRAMEASANPESNETKGEETARQVMTKIMYEGNVEIIPPSDKFRVYDPVSKKLIEFDDLGSVDNYIASRA